MRIAATLLLFFFSTTLWAETTPMNEPLPEQTEITIACECTKTESGAQTGTYHYRLWLPKGYSADPQRRWPCIFIANPSGFANPSKAGSMMRMGPWLKSHGYVAVMLVESKNGPWAPIFGNFIAAHDDVIKRVRIQEGLKIATGFSGGSRASSCFVQMRPGFSGLIMQSAAGTQSPSGGLTKLRDNPSFFVAMTFGKNDNICKGEDKLAKSVFANSPRFKLWYFDGAHAWAPQEQFEEAITWMEKQIYEQGTPNPALRPVYIQHFQSEAARLSETTGAWQRYKLIDALFTFSRSRNIANEPSIAPRLRELQAEAVKLYSDPAVTREAQAAEALKRLEQSAGRGSPSIFEMTRQNIIRQFAGTEAATKAENLKRE